MSVRLTFMCATAGDTTRSAVFGDGPLSEHGLCEARAVGATLPPYSPVVRAPSVRCALTADALGLDATAEPALRDFDYGNWRGRTVREVVQDDPYGYASRLTDPDATPHGGESVRQLCRRVAHWLSSVPPFMDHALVITEPAVVRASLVHALSAPATAFWHFEVPPLSTVSLTLREGRWNVRPGRLGPERAGTSRTVPMPCDAPHDPRAPLWGDAVSDEWYDLVARVTPSDRAGRTMRPSRPHVAENRTGGAATAGGGPVGRALAARGREPLGTGAHRVCGRCRVRLHPRTEPER
ncbi:histidine phosphatase family protein [Streptomyces sp. NBC_01571]|uniref:histidine phosphatase family protein n=1 Tax=Streptomyces sp. NBC_01571 TaxID=2975883 RepID=UPI00225B78A1|nr:histidine phosphatase family protein [Streptomyces sp. NBC_01571]MCX4572164.1 histidine phosphatase family protein [Streptomyces sp. NBC_01571]